MIFARDKISYDFLQNALSSIDSIFQAPDITISSKVKSVRDNLSKHSQVYGCIVPNARMFDRGDSGWANLYISRLVLAAQEMHLMGVKPVILVHSIEGSEDQPIAEEVQKLVGKDICSIKQANDPLETKVFISESHLLVGSRYHSIVSALSSGVPAIVMSWAHKYETILEDFGMKDFIHKVDNDEKHLSNLLDYMLDVNNNKELRIILNKKIEPMIKENEEMWEKVYNVLGLS